MSGVEAIGSALATLTLLINTVQHLEQITAYLAGIRKVPREIATISSALQTQQRVLRQTLEVLLPDENIAQLTDWRPGAGVEVSELHLKFISRLGDAYPLFCTVTQDLDDAVHSANRLLSKITDSQKDDGIGGFTRTKLRWAFSDKRKTQEATEVFQRRALRLNDLLTTVTIHHSIEAQQAVNNLSASLNTVLGVERIAQNLEDITTGGEPETSGEDDDMRSNYSVESEVGAVPPE